MAPTIASFVRAVRAHYRTHRRDMPWRRDTSPYAIAVSEIMLQQTQVSRVAPKFDSWMRRFPDWQALARASTRHVLREWSGLGYNRRALYLKRIADTLTQNGAKPGRLPETYEGLRALPGIGPNTAGAILAYAFNRPHPFIETNIRSAYIHHFFPHASRRVSDAELMPLIGKTLELPSVARDPRHWHWALMDYGSHLKASVPNPSRRSAHHAVQKPFKGSNRELRSIILKQVMNKPSTASALLRAFKDHPASRIRKNLSDLAREGFITATGGTANRVYEIA